MMRWFLWILGFPSSSPGYEKRRSNVCCSPRSDEEAVNKEHLIDTMLDLLSVDHRFDVVTQDLCHSTIASLSDPSNMRSDDNFGVCEERIRHMSLWIREQWKRLSVIHIKSNTTKLRIEKSLVKIWI
jgi:hypothetical protein